MEFKYFRNPQKFAVFAEERMNCDVCGFKSKCFDGTLFYSEELVEAICPKCLKSGRLAEAGIFANDADVEALFEQMTQLNTDKTHEELLRLAKAKINEVETQTPPIFSWEDWKFPALDGDFCEFIEFVSKDSLNELAENGDGLAFLKKYLRTDEENLINPEILWDELPTQYIETIDQTNRQCLAYLFKSRVTETYLIIWDNV
jgi:uncharacterized protein CbrC (UPF0167 family)